MPITSRPEFLTNNEAANFLGITPGTLEVWRCTKRYPLPFYKVGGKVRYEVHDLLAFLESRKVRFSQEAPCR
jgi:excisionase family DNA binding protein